jgi:hypothetical protein
MTRRERGVLLAVAIVLAIVCSALFARAVVAQRAVDFARAQARAALLPERTTPTSDVAARTMLDWSGGTEQLHYWQALQRFRVVTKAALNAAQYTVGPPLSLVFRLEETVTYLRSAALSARSPALRSRLDDILGLAYYDDARLHAGEEPIAPQLERHAAAAFRQAVLSDGSNDAAKTNLEVLLRILQAERPPKARSVPPKPDTTRGEGLLGGPSGFPEMNGAVGPHTRGGY